jgi:hypothetical protein
VTALVAPTARGGIDMTTERNDKEEPQVEVDELRDLDPPNEETDDVRGGACAGRQALGGAAGLAGGPTSMAN